MRLSCRFSFTLLGGSLLFPSFAQGQQPWSNILSTNRAINWQSAGMPPSFTDKGGSNVETTTNPWTPPTRTQYGSTITPSGSAATDLSNINTALSNCSDGQYVLLGAGTFQIQGNIVMYQHSCTLRGSGAQSTILAMNSGSPIIMLGAASGGGSCTLTSGSNLAVGSTSITCTGNEPAVGDIVWLNQCDTGFSGNPCSGTSADNGGLFVCGYQSTCMTDTGATGFNESQQQNFIVTSVSGSGGTYTIGLNTGLYMPNWAFAQTPILTWYSSPYAGVGMGLEDMTIYNTAAGWIQLQNAYASWIKGVRFIGTALASVASDKNCLVMSNYVFSDIVLDSNYPRAMNISASSDTLILNNMMTSGVPWEGLGGNAGNVMAYNYGRDTFTMYVENSFFDHAAYSSLDLFEGNETSVLDEDDTWGTHDLNTYFRNYAECWDAPYSTYSGGGAAARGIQIGNYQRFENVIGNAIGDLSWCPTYQAGSSSGVIFQVSTVDSLAGTSLMRWGNVSAVEQPSDTPANSGIRFVSSEVPATLPSPNASLENAVPSSTNLPASFFMSVTAHPSGGTGLSWWKVCKTWTAFPTVCAATQTQPFPIAGPDVSGGAYVNGYAYDIPAAIAWRYLPVDTTYQNSYTISSSSWSDGTETLTFSSDVLPNTTHLMGAFQLSSVNSACTTGATFGNNSEILMTGSSSTTVQYALATNPGNSCTGTMLFPDLRQFDERVYENDPATAPISTTTTLTASATQITQGVSVTFTATVAPSSGTATPAGTVTFYNGSTQLGSGALDSSAAATYSTTSLPVGADSVAADYGGDADFAASASSPVTVTVTAAAPPDFTLGANPTSLTLPAGNSGTVVLTVTPEDGFNQAVSLSCSAGTNLTCSGFTSSTVTPNGSAVTSTLTLTASASSSAQRRAPFQERNQSVYGLGIPGFLGLLAVGLRRKRKLPAIRLLVLVLCVLVAGLDLSSCGNTSTKGTSSTTSTATITASTSGANAITHTANVTVTVTH